jgi:Arc/MetJ-type ribon-helix-helix transcriptional regulator
MYGMRKTTLYLPEDLKRAVERVAAERRCSEAELIREALRTLTLKTSPPQPRLPLFKSGKRQLAERVATALAGFGER